MALSFHLNNLYADDRIDLRLSLHGVSILSRINQELGQELTGLSFLCKNDSCALQILPDIEPKLNVALINKPFEEKLLVLRLHGGSQHLQKKLYTALGKLVPTRDFNEFLTERKLVIEDGGISFRCVSSRHETPRYECWSLFYAKSLDVNIL